MRKTNITRNGTVPPSVTPPNVTGGVPAPLEAMLRLDQVLALLGCSRSTLYAGIAEKRYPEPIKNGRISLWTTESIRNWMADPANFKTYVAAKTAAPRGIGRSAAFGSSVEQMIAIERALEVLVLVLLNGRYELFCSANKPSQYDVKAAAAVQARLAELEAGAAGNIPVLKRWRPSARA